MSVKSHLWSVCSSLKFCHVLNGNKGDFSKTTLLQRYTTSCVVGYCSNIPRTFSTAEPSKGTKKANIRLDSTWNTTRCKAARFFLFSLRLLPEVIRILPVNVITSPVRALSRIRTRAYATLVHSFNYASEYSHVYTHGYEYG